MDTKNQNVFKISSNELKILKFPKSPQTDSKNQKSLQTGVKTPFIWQDNKC